MNELMIILQDNTYMYYQTAENTAKNALQNFYTTCASNGINLDNIVIAECRLRNSRQKDIDTLCYNERKEQKREG